MLFFGHIAVAVAVADATGSDTAATVAGNLIPDVVDKSASRVLRLTPTGRWIAHGLPFMALSLALLRPALSERHWRGLAFGYLAHLLGDLYGGAKVPWLAPFQKPPHRFRYGFRPVALTIAAETLGLAFLLFRAGRDQG